MKINFTLFGSGLTGGNFNIMEPAQRLALRGHEVSITSIGSPRDLNWFRGNKPLFKETFTPLSGKLHYRIYRKILNGTMLHPFPWVEIRDLVRSMPDCDVNIATAAPTSWAVHRSGKGKGFYYIQHYDSFFVENQLVNKIHDESYYLPLKKLTVSSWLKNIVEDKLEVKVSNVINAGIEEKFFYPREKNNRKTRIISLGRKVPWKGFLELETAMRELFRERDDFEWVVFSSHDTPIPRADAPFTLVKSPYGKDLGALYASCNIAVNPSWHEGFAQPALEAMASGCTVVTTPIGAEDFMEDGVNCLRIEPKNPSQIKESLVRLLDDKKLIESLSLEGLKTAKRFYWDNIINKWETILHG